MRAADLSVVLAGEPAKVSSVVPPGGPSVLLVVIDLVGDLNRIDAARRALARHIEGLGANDYVALLRAQDGLRVVCDPSADRRRTIELLDALPVAGFPGLLDSVEPSAAIADAMAAASPVRIAVLYLTDGGIEDYRGDYSSEVVNPSDRGDLSRRFRDRLVQERISTLTANLGRYAAPLFFVHLEERTDALNVAYQNGIRQFAAVSGGEAWFARSLAEAPTLVERALERISRQHMVAIEVPADRRGALPLRVEGPAGAVLTHREALVLGGAQKDSRKKRKSKQP